MVRVNEPVTIKPASERLALLYRISQTINSSLDLDKVMETVMDEVISVTNAERGFLMVFGADGKLGLQTARGIDSQTLGAADFKISRGIVDRVASEGTPLLTSNAQTDDRLDSRASIRLYGLRSVLCAPLISREKILGVIYVDNHFQNGIFSEDDLELVNSIASSAAIAIENARLYQLAVEQGRMQRELQMAREVQVSLIPPETPQIEGWEFAACWKPAHEVSGDFYDFIPLPSGKLGIVLADVSDKGMPAALFMALSRSVIRSVVGQNGFPSEDITKANHLIHRDAAEGMFITLFYAEIDTRKNSITYVNAGHNPPIFVVKKTGEHQLLQKTGMAAGIETNTRYEQEVLDFHQGDMMAIYTDGVVDAEIDGAPFGMGRLQKALGSSNEKSASDVVTHLENLLCTYVGTEQPTDDITLLVIRRSI